MKPPSNALSLPKRDSKNQFDQITTDKIAKQIRLACRATKLPYMLIEPVLFDGIGHVIEQIVFGFESDTVRFNFEGEISIRALFMPDDVQNLFVIDFDNGRDRLLLASFLFYQSFYLKQYFVMALASSQEYYEYLMTMILLQCSDELEKRYPLVK